MARILFFDTETTGGVKDYLVQIGLKERGVAEPVANAIYKPPVPIEIGAMAIHHITEKMVAGRPAFKESAEYAPLKELIEGDAIVVTHNAPFDIGVIGREGITPTRFICTLKVSRAVDAEELIPSHALQYLRHHHEMEIDASAHDAWGDVLVLEQLFEILMKEMIAKHGSEEATLEEMLAITARPTLRRTFRFGKHNGKKIRDVAQEDSEYLRWLLKEKKKQPRGEEDWIYSLETYLKEGEEKVVD